MNRIGGSRDKSTRLFELLEALRDTERQIAELRVDVAETPVDGRHRASLFRRAKRQRRQTDIAAQAAILEALPAHIAVLDAAGFIIAVNDAWRLYDRGDTACGPGHAIGLNYLDACDGATGGSLIERRMASEIRAVLMGTRARVAMEYPCPLPSMERWLAVTVVPLDAGHRGGAIIMHVDVTAAHESEERYRILIETSFDAVVISQDGIILEVNAGFERTFGYSASEVVGHPAAEFAAAESQDRVRDQVSDDADATYEFVGLRKDGRRILLDATTRLHHAGGRAARITALRDMTERKHLEARLRQAQKMDAVGRLAAGIAHDFNNQLSVILACASFVHEDLPADDPRRDDIEAIQAAATGAAALTRQLLVFGRQQVIPPRIVALNASVDDADRMLRRLIGEDMSLVIVHGRSAATTMIDPSYVEQLIMNLVANARDAMPTGGTITIETRVVDLDDSFARPDWPIVAGRFAMLAVTDTGIGMNPDTAAQAFDPFFTTKASGAGTGLGLATVYGIVKQCGGSVSVYTELGHGTCFKIYLPFVSGEGLPEQPELTAVDALHGTEWVLLAEDSAPVRRAIRQMLERFGYRVIEAATSALALELARSASEIDLLLTDVIMPEMNGRILAERVGALRPGMKVLFMSGYTDDAVLRHGILSSAVHYIEKPFRPQDLARKLRHVLDAPTRTSPVAGEPRQDSLLDDLGEPH